LLSIHLAWQDGSPLTVIGTDGGLLEKPVYRRFVMLGPGERVELWADFSKHPVGSETALTSQPFDGGMLRRGMMGSGVLPNGAGFTICKVKVDRQEKEALTLPQSGA
jgi:FtsP/CotA-like multicopper oxidase with cupredoxin domain